LFEAIETTGQTLVRSLIELLNKYGLRKNIIAYVKNEGSNLNAMTIVLQVVIKLWISWFRRELLRHLLWACLFKSMSIWHCTNLKYVSIQSAQENLQKCIIWLKKSRKGRQEWNKACLEMHSP